MAMQSLIDAMELLGIQYAERTRLADAKLISSVEYRTVQTFDGPYVQAIKNLWDDAGIKQCYARYGSRYDGDVMEHVLNPSAGHDIKSSKRAFGRQLAVLCCRGRK